MSLFTNEEFGHLAICLNECRCPTCKRIAEKICDDHRGIDPYERRIEDVIEKLEKLDDANILYNDEYSRGLNEAISLLKNGR